MQCSVFSRPFLQVSAQLGSAGPSSGCSPNSSACASSWAWVGPVAVVGFVVDGLEPPPPSRQSQPQPGRWSCGSCTSGPRGACCRSMPGPHRGSSWPAGEVAVLIHIRRADVHQAVEAGDHMHALGGVEPLGALAVADAVARRQVHEAHPAAGVPAQPHLARTGRNSPSGSLS